MQQIKKLSSVLLFLLVEMVLFSFKTMRQLVLPSAKTKGNILSSLFIFFIGTIERMGCLKSYLLTIPFLKPKHIRQVILMAGMLLFLLSLVEYSHGKLVDDITVTRITTPSSNQLGQCKAINKNWSLKNDSFFSSKLIPSPSTPVPNDLPVFSVKHFIFIHGLRI